MVPGGRLSNGQNNAHSLVLLTTQRPPPKPPPKTSIARFLPKLPSAFSKSPESSSSFRKLVYLAKAERKPLAAAVGLLLVSASVSLSVPFTIGRLIDFFSTTNPVCTTLYVALQLPLGLSAGSAAALLLVLFTTGAVANAGRAMIMKMAGECISVGSTSPYESIISIQGQRIVARLREQTYTAALKQEVEFVERGEGDVLSRLSVDTTIVGESVTQNLSDGLRAVLMASVGCNSSTCYTLGTSSNAVIYQWGDVLFVANSNDAYAGGRSSGIPRYSTVDISRNSRIERKRLWGHDESPFVSDLREFVASESLSALRTVQAFNAVSQEQEKFHQRVNRILDLARKEAIATGYSLGVRVGVAM
ncbi:ATP-binding cassette permease mdl [Salix suchowensis]|nr:ATP-binding cassette permease mdl [Salix suchowensis]